MADVLEESQMAAGEEADTLSKLASDENVKHPLQNRWTLWYFKNEKNKNWKEMQHMVSSFATVEDFWALYNHIQPASQLTQGCDYSFFKDGIMPMWEDTKNRRGGRWMIGFDRKERNNQLDRMWLETLLCLVGEAFDEHGDIVCGAVVNIRPKGDKLAVWTEDANNMEANMKIGRKLKERLNIPANIVLGYQSHADSMSKTGSVTRNQYSL